MYVEHPVHPCTLKACLHRSFICPNFHPQLCRALFVVIFFAQNCDAGFSLYLIISIALTQRKYTVHTQYITVHLNFLAVFAQLISSLSTLCSQGSHQGFHASSQHHFWHAGLPHELCTWHPWHSFVRAETWCVLGLLGLLRALCKDQFDAKVYGIVIQSLVEEPGPLPTLFMRTVIQVVAWLLKDWNVMAWRQHKNSAQCLDANRCEQMCEVKCLRSRSFLDSQISSLWRFSPDWFARRSGEMKTCGLSLRNEAKTSLQSLDLALLLVA